MDYGYFIDVCYTRDQDREYILGIYKTIWKEHRKDLMFVFPNIVGGYQLVIKDIYDITRNSVVIK